MASVYVTVGDLIAAEPGFLSGHGTQVKGEQLFATVCGFVERVNQLVSVRPVHSRYNAEIGDVIVGRVVDLGDKRWKIDINARHHAMLLLSAVNLPGGVQRRKTYEDSLQMRSFFAEGDLISAEVQALKQEGQIALHTRSVKYGKLENGLFLSVSPNLIKRSKQHFHSLPCGVDLILGNNGYVWLTGSQKGAKVSVSAFDINSTEVKAASAPVEIDSDTRECIARVRNCILALSEVFVPIQLSSILQVYDDSVRLGLQAKELLLKENLQRITQTALANA